MRLPDLVIALGAQLSNEVELASVDKLTVYGAAAYTGVVTLQFSPNGADWFDGDAVAAATMLEVPLALAERVRLSSTLAEAAERVTPLHGGGPNSV